ncbi:MAG: glycosyltransferase [Bacteroidetes bacterium]|nr:MAG: glycosyltransferase [Bacteroidota bacterium]
MHILFIHTIGKNKYGGGERWVIKAASGLAGRGHDVTVGGRGGSVLLAEAEKRGVKTHTFNILSNLSIYQAFRIARYIRKNKIDVVFTKGRDQLVSGLAARWGGASLVLKRSGLPPSGKSKKNMFLTRKFVDGIVTNTHSIEKIYHQMGFTEPGFVKVIYNGLEINKACEPYDFTSKFPGRTMVMCLGRLVASHKGYFFLLDAISEIKKQFPQLLFFIVGEGKDKQRLIDYAREKGVDEMVHFEGYVHDPSPYLKACDFFVHASLYEGMPNAAMEAMAYGKPVIMTRVNGAEELSNNGQFAYLIPPFDSSAIAEALKFAMGNPEDFKITGEKAKTFVRQKFGMETMVTQLQAFIEQRMQVKKNK